MDEFRPEYVEALNAARWNFWWIFVFGPPVFLIGYAAISRTRGRALYLASCVISWFSFGFAVQYYWNTKMIVAVTEAEKADAYGDTAALYGPVIVGMPFVLIYTCLVAAIFYGGVGTVRWWRNRELDKSTPAAE